MNLSLRSVPLLAALLLSATAFLPAQEATRGAARFSGIEQVVNGWTADRHLWVQGNPGVTDENLDALEGWLDENGSNWTVVLMETAAGQAYDGRSGMTAVEFALGEGLSNRTGFGALVDARTGEANGAVFVLFLRERKFSYFASDIFDKWLLGERYWVGRLDAPAIRAMRNGGRIVDAVKDTVTSIEGQLTRKLDEAAERKRLAEIERQKAIAEAKEYPARLSILIEEAAGRASALREDHPGLVGEVTRPDVSAWRGEVEAITRLAAQSDHENARSRFSETSSAIAEFQEGLDAWEAAPVRFADLESRIANHPAPEKEPVVGGHLANAAAALDSARENHAAGDPHYRGQLAETERALAQAGSTYASWSAAELQRKRLVRALAILLAVGLVAFLVVANLLRRPARDEARVLLRAWQSQLKGKFDRLFDLMDRTGLVVGTSSDLDDRGFDGTTESLARRAIRGVDELFIMSAATDRVLEEASALVEPASLAGSLLNTFSSRRYRRASALLGSEPIGFDRHDHLEAILHPESASRRVRERTLLGQADDYEPFRISLEQLIQEYDSREASLRDDIYRLESGIDGLPLAQRELLNLHGETSDHAAALALTAHDDGLFPLLSLRGELLPAAMKKLEETAALGETDPVEAYERHLPEATRLASEADAIARTIGSFRTADLPPMREAVERLEERERATAWVDEALEALDAEGERLATRACFDSVATEWSGLDDDLTRLRGRITGCESMTRRIAEELDPLAELRERETRDARKELTSRLELASRDVLSEPGLSPDEALEVYRLGVRNALAAIDRGEATTAQRDLSGAAAALDDAAAMVALSRECAEEHPGWIADLRSEREALLGEVEPVSGLLAELQDGYAPTVLLFSSRYGEEIEGQASVLACVERARRRLDHSGETLEESGSAYSTGALIQAHGLLEVAANELGFARHQLSLVRDQHEALRAAEAENDQRAEKLKSRHRELELVASDRRTTRATLDGLASAGEAATAFAASLGTTGSDPFVQQREGLDLEGTFNALEDGISADWKAFELAESSATGAKAALVFCHTHLKEAHRDGIPDSPELTGAIRLHGELSEEIGRIRDQDLESAHSDWNAIFQRINEITAETAELRSVLEKELAAAGEAASKLKLASSAIADIHSWRSYHSVSINRRAGSQAILRAKQALATGDYAAARSHAIASRGAALRELQRARSEESRKIAAAAEARRRAARRSSSSSFRSGSSFSSSSSSFSSSSSGFSSSSFSSSSGFSRSGW